MKECEVISISNQEGGVGKTTTSVIISRINNILYVSTNGGGKQQIVDFSTFTRVFDSTLAIGASLDENNNPQRYFTGSMSNIKVLWID